jgi:predicted ATPase
MTSEVGWRVPSLPLPDPQRLPPLEELDRFDTIRLFRDRARLNQSSFTVTDQNAPAMAQVCHRLDGIPLAIELAAGRVKNLSIQQIAARREMT